MLWPVAVSAAELLTSDDVRRLRSCADSRCPRLFVDRSRSRQRLWCDMSLCGSRAKNRRYRRRFAGLPPSAARITSKDA